MRSWPKQHIILKEIKQIKLKNRERSIFHNLQYDHLMGTHDSRKRHKNTYLVFK